MDQRRCPDEDQNPNHPNSPLGIADFDLNISLVDTDLNFPPSEQPINLDPDPPRSSQQKQIELIDLDPDDAAEAPVTKPQPPSLDLSLWDFAALATSLASELPELDNGKGKAPVTERREAAVLEEQLRFEDSLRESRRLAKTRRRDWEIREQERRKRENRELAATSGPKFAICKREAEKYVEIFPTYGMSEDNTAPFSDAMKVVEKRGKKIQWTPLRTRGLQRVGTPVPSLKDLCLGVLVDNAEEIESLEEIPDVLKDTLLSILCSKRKMSVHVLGLYFVGSQTRVHVGDCSWVTEEDYMGLLPRLNCEKLSVLQLDLCGPSITNYVLRGTLAKSPGNLPSLTTISLKGAFRLSDDGLDALVASAPLLSSVNLGQCNLLTSDGIIKLASKLNPVLRELVLDDCQNVNAMAILPALRKLKFLEVLSVARIPNVDDNFVYNLVRVCGPQFKELVLADCQKLTVAAMRAIGETCPQLCVLDIRNLVHLNDFAMRHLASGCRSMQTLKLRRNKFSDEAIAAFVEASGGSLTELSLNNIAKVAECTALAISLRCSHSLRSLDLSFCRGITDEALGLIVDSCSKLRSLILFGCTQITGSFMSGHSNFNCKIIGYSGPILEQLKTPDFL